MHQETERAAIVLDQKNAILAVHIAGQIDGTALVGSFLNVSVGAESAAGGEHAPGAAFGLKQQAVLVGALRAVAAAQFGTVAGRATRNDIEHAADGARSVKITGAAAHHFNTFDSKLGLLLPVNPTGKRIVERHIVFSKQGAAGGGGTQSAQAHSLGRGIGDQRTGAAE